MEWCGTLFGSGHGGPMTTIFQANPTGNLAYTVTSLFHPVITLPRSTRIAEGFKSRFGEALTGVRSCPVVTAS